MFVFWFQYKAIYVRAEAIHNLVSLNLGSHLLD